MGARPPIRFVRWVWRVSQAAPGAGITGRIVSAALLASQENSRGPSYAGMGESIRGVEWWLAYKPWQDGNRRTGYVEAYTRAENPIKDLGVLGLPESEPENVAELRVSMERLSGGPDTFLWYLIQMMLTGI